MVTVDARDLNRLIAATGNLGDAKLSPLTADLAAETVKQTQRRFDRRTAPDGSRWKPRKDNLPHPLLEKSGRLRRSIGERDLQETTAEIGIGAWFMPVCTSTAATAYRSASSSAGARRTAPTW